MTKTCTKTGAQGDSQRWLSFKTSKAHCFAAKIIDCYSFVFIVVHDKRLLDPSVLSPDIYVFQNPGDPSSSIFTCLEPYVPTWPPYMRIKFSDFENIL